MPDNEIQYPQKWLIVFLIYADFTDNDTTIQNDIFIGIDNLFKDILKTPIAPDLCRTFIMMDSASYHNKANDVYIRNTICLYEIGNSDNTGANLIKSKIILSESEQKVEHQSPAAALPQRHLYQSTDPLTKILSTIKIDKKEEVLFVTWDHGAGFGIFPDPLATKLTSGAPVTPPLTIFEKKAASYRYLRTFWNFPVTSRRNKGFLKAYKKNDQLALPVPDILDNCELADALSNWLHENKTDRVGVLLMMNCWMMNLHTIYAMKGAVKCFVAPQTEICNPGYDYPEIIRNICDQKKATLTPQKLAICCAESRTSVRFRKRAIKIGIDASKMKETVDDCLIIAMDLQVMIPIEAQFNTLNQLVSQVTQVLQDEALAANGASRPISNLIALTWPLALDFTKGKVGLVDFPSYIEMISAIAYNCGMAFEVGSLRNKINAYVTSYSATVFPDSVILYDLSNRSNPKFCPDRQADYVAPRPKGASMFFADLRDLNQKISYNVDKDKLLKSMPEWKKALTILFNK